MNRDDISAQRKVFSSSQLVAQETGYTRDYIGQLCREGKLECERRGKEWFVERNSLRSYLEKARRAKRERGYKALRSSQKKRPTVAAPPSPAQQSEPEAPQPKPASAFRFSHDERPLIPTPRKDLPAHTSAIVTRLPHHAAALQQSSQLAFPITTQLASLLQRGLVTVVVGAFLIGTILVGSHAEQTVVFTNDVRDSVFAQDVSQAEASLNAFLQKADDVSFALNDLAGTVASGELTAAITLTTAQNVLDGSALFVYRTTNRLFETTRSGFLAIFDPSRDTGTDAPSLLTDEERAKIAERLRTQQEIDENLQMSDDRDDDRVAREATRTAPPTVIEKPVIERVIERERVITQSGLSEAEIRDKLAVLEAKLRAELGSLSAQTASNAQTIVNNYTTISRTNKIDDLGNVTIHDSSITSSSFSGSSVSADSGSFDTLSVSDDATFNTATFSGTLTGASANFSGDLTVSGALTVSGGQTINGGITTSHITATSTATSSSIAYRLGVGTTTPNNILSIAGNTGPQLVLTDTSAGVDLKHVYASSTAGALAFGSLNDNLSTYTEHVRFDSSGNVGVGTTSPAQKLSINGSGYITDGLGIGIATTTSGVLETASNAYIGGNLTVLGDSVVFGDSTSDTLTISSSINSDLIPDSNATRDLGSPAFYWGNAYIDVLNANTISSASTTISGTQSADFTLNTDNNTTDTEDMNLIFFRGNVVPNAVIGWDATLDRFDFNQPLFVQNDSSTTTVPTLDLKGTAGQTANVFDVASSSGSSLFAVTSNGNVGVGTDSPSYKVEVNGGDVRVSGLIDASHFVGTSSATSTLAGGIEADLLNITTTGATSTIVHALETGGLRATNGLTVTAGGVDLPGGVIDNAELVNDSVSYGGVSVSLGGSDATPAFDLTDATNLPIDAGTTGTLPISRGGTGQTSFTNNTVLTIDDNGAFIASSTLRSSVIDDVYVFNTGDTITGTLTFGGVATDITTGTNEDLTFSPNGTGNSIFSSGNVGIGTNEPDYNLHIVGTTTTGAARSRLVLDDQNSGAGTVGRALIFESPFDSESIGRIRLDGTTSDLRLGTRDRNDLLVLNNSGNLGIGTTTPWKRLSVSETVSDSQFSISYDNNRYTNFQVDSAGDLIIDPQGDDVFLNDDNLWVCTGGSCPSGTPSGTGNLVVESKLGIGTSSPAKALDVAGIIRASGRHIQLPDSAGEYAAGSAGSRILHFTNDDDLYIDNFTSQIRLRTVSNERFTIDDSNTISLGNATSTIRGDLSITGKLDVGTIDPVYTIDGTKYATYGHSTVGIKEETVMKVTLTEYNEENDLYEYTIDFDELTEGTDTWLFYQISNFGENWENLVTTVTAGFPGSVYFEEKPDENKLIIQGTKEGLATVRLIADRYDSSKWPNLRPDQNEGYEGHIIESKQTPASR